MGTKYYLCCNCGHEDENEELPDCCPFCAAGQDDLMLQSDGFFYGDSEFEEPWCSEEEWSGEV